MPAPAPAVGIPALFSSNEALAPVSNEHHQVVPRNLASLCRRKSDSGKEQTLTSESTCRGSLTGPGRDAGLLAAEREFLSRRAE